VPEITGIECAGEVLLDSTGRLPRGQKVVALMGGMGRTRNGSYAQLVTVPSANVVPIATDLPWEALAALPESYATAWTCLVGNLDLHAGQTLVVRGATSALGQAALNIAVDRGAAVIATTRNPARKAMLEQLGAARVMVGEVSAADVLSIAPPGVDAVLDLLGTATLLDSLAMARVGGRVCVAGFLAGGHAMERFDPVFQMPSGVQLSAFASAFAFGSASHPLSAIPFQEFVNKAATAVYRSAPSRVFAFEEIVEAHRLMESNLAGGKIVVTVS
jgi:NADPH:quinone reductase-like Zn-dependent oxidoreductase